MTDFLQFCANNFIIFLVVAIVLGFGVSGFFIDKNTNVLEIEKQKKALLEKSMNIEEVKSHIKDNSISLGSAIGITGNVNHQSNNNNDNPAPLPVATPHSNNANEDLSVPLNLNSQ